MLENTEYQNLPAKTNLLFSSFSQNLDTTILFFPPACIHKAY